MQNESAGLWMHETSITQQKTRAGNPTRVFKKVISKLSFFNSGFLEQVGALAGVQLLEVLT